MLQTYKAILRGDRLEWSGDAPEQSRTEHAVDVHVTILNEDGDAQTRGERGRKMAEALERLAARNALREISDPVSWQREQREDRILPDRDE